jgi:hypothetical protein
VKCWKKRFSEKDRFVIGIKNHFCKNAETVRLFTFNLNKFILLNFSIKKEEKKPIKREKAKK